MDMPEDIAASALAWHRAGQGAALAWVVETWGSAPRTAGSLLALRGDGAFVGSVSGGCVEAEVIAAGQVALEDGVARVLEFGVSDEQAFGAGLACGGRIRVLVEPVGAGLPEAMLAALCEAHAQRRPVAYVVDLKSWDRRLDPGTSWPEHMRRDRSGTEADGHRFVAVQNPPLRLVVVGAVHIAQALIPMARAAGYDVTLADPREAFATEARFPGVSMVLDYGDEIDLGLDARSAVVTLSHVPRIDDPALATALGSEAFYIGALGSMRTHARRVERLSATGFGEDQIARIHAPVGLNIGARSPAEIAVSVLAQMTEALRMP